ncbi:uncharacterized protein LAESUDRAFT_810096 [Laetiporus sulphureus 93-53]|uniref:Aminoglycoside phosphotransferase domain-containing protein n=1 Tax=Laetiporus sulphureus 93-53 TaxID=1314785 RepID=A0A165GK53_9APHY|nr:uncharacterized protein LAESUDRAFT_810096 [Laetiporus sulphureus 93-53]KZT10464.1 hypothetical protein LAESUDRAFT_810096 [Laetiporus sulphureus 93-53]
MPSGLAFPGIYGEASDSRWMLTGDPTGKDAFSYISSFFKCEQQWLARFAKPRDPSDPFYLSTEDNSPAAHIAVLDQFLACLPHIMPDLELRYPALWHTDLYRSNIFVESPQPTILGVIGWQWTDIGPFYAQAIFPKAFVYDLPLEERELVRMEQNEAFAMCYQQTLITNTPPCAAVMSTPYLSTVVDPVSRVVTWDEIAPAGTPCPLNYTNEDAERILSHAVQERDYENNIERPKALLNVQIDGKVDTEQYDEVLGRK